MTEVEIAALLSKARAEIDANRASLNAREITGREFARRLNEITLGLEEAGVLEHWWNHLRETL